MEVFVRWGAAPGADEPESCVVEAATTDIDPDDGVDEYFWPAADAFIEVCAEAVGFVGVGNVFAPGGYHSQPADCPSW
jgi:hypothetical protein